MPTGEPVHKTTAIAAPATRVWAALTEPGLMKQWMAETEMEIITDWVVGHPFIIRGPWYKTYFENRGTVLHYDAEQALSYSHLSSLSRLPDAPENYTVLLFTLQETEGQTKVDLELSNFPTDAIYHHFAFYWTVALDLLRKFVERGQEGK